MAIIREQTVALHDGEAISMGSGVFAISQRDEEGAPHNVVLTEGDMVKLLAYGQPQGGRLGRWWRLWIIFSCLWAAFSLTMATVMGGWENGVSEVLAASASYPTAFLIIGLSVTWIRKGRS